MRSFWPAMLAFVVVMGTPALAGGEFPPGPPDHPLQDRAFDIQLGRLIQQDLQPGVFRTDEAIGLLPFEALSARAAERLTDGAGTREQVVARGRELLKWADRAETLAPKKGDLWLLAAHLEEAAATAFFPESGSCPQLGPCVSPPDTLRAEREAALRRASRARAQAVANAQTPCVRAFASLDSRSAVDVINNCPLAQVWSTYSRLGTLIDQQLDAVARGPVSQLPAEWMQRCARDGLALERARRALCVAKPKDARRLLKALVREGETACSGTVEAAGVMLEVAEKMTPRAPGWVWRLPGETWGCQ